MILALDTSTDTSSLALHDGEVLVAELTWQTRATTQQVLPMVQQCFALVHRQPADVSGVAVALGPGSFNGLRVGLSLSKGLAFALHVPVFGLPTPDIAAYPFSSLVLPVCTLLRAGRERYISTLFQTRYGRWQRIGEMHNVSLEEICQETERTTLFCGEIDARTAAGLHERLGQRALLASPALSSRRAGYLAEMAWKRLQDEPQGDDLATLQPLYLSRPRIGDTVPAAAAQEVP